MKRITMATATVSTLIVLLAPVQARAEAEPIDGDPVTTEGAVQPEPVAEDVAGAPVPEGEPAPAEPAPVTPPASEGGSATESASESASEQPQPPAPPVEPASEPERASRPAVERDPDHPGTLLIGDLTLAPLVEVRFRGEVRTDPYTGSGPGPNQYFVGSRARLGLDLGYRWLRVAVLFQDARSFGQFPVGTDNGSTTGLHLGFLELRRGRDLWLRLGRQEILYGAQRMIGALNWSTPGRSFDALRLHAHRGAFDIDAMAAMVRTPRTIDWLDTEGNALTTQTEGDWLATMSFGWAPLQAVSLEVYLLYRHDGPTEPTEGTDPTPAITRQRDIAAPGLRLSGAPVPGLRYDLEVWLQAGRAGGERHLALAVATEVSYALQVPGRPGLALGAAYASGGAPGDDLTEFDNFYPTNHIHYGAADLIGLRNMIEGHARLFALPENIRLVPSISFYLLALDDPARPWKNAGGGVIGVSSDNEDRVLGYELDVNIAWQAASWLQVSGGYAVFIPSAGAENLGHTEATHWAYLMIGSVLP